MISVFDHEVRDDGGSINGKVGGYRDRVDVMIKMAVLYMFR